MNVGLRARALLVLAAAVLGAALAAVRPPAAAAVSAPSLAVRGNRVVDGAGQPIVLSGVNRSGTEYACAQGWGIFDGPSDAASIEPMLGWGVTAVRVPLNEHCWLGINGVPRHLGGTAYRDAVAGYVDRLLAAGLVVVLDLHWSGPGSQLALAQAEMPDADHAPGFWSSVATQFANRPGVVFDLFNEPRDVDWDCWRDGCTTASGWEAVGMQDLLDTVRSVGAGNPVIATGLGWGNDLYGWLEHRPSDPAGALIAGLHLYNFSGCITEACWDDMVAPVAAQVPVVTAELGEDTCGHAFVDRFFDWAEPKSISTMAWTWNDWAGCQGPSLLLDYGGTPSGFGSGVRDRYQQRAAEAAGPVVSVGDVAVVEGHAASRTGTFVVTLSEPAGHDVTVDFRIAAATAASPSDFSARTGSLVVRAGAAQGGIAVTVRGDSVAEGNETFSITLTRAAGGRLDRATGTGTILDDDPGGQRAGIGNAAVVEPVAGTTAVHLTVTMSSPAASPVTVSFATAAGSAAAPGDYRNRTGSVTIPAGKGGATISVIVNGDAVEEASETFGIRLTKVTGAALGRATGTVTVLDR